MSDPEVFMTIQAYWESFRADVLPPSASVEQISDMRAAFYSGAGIFSKMMMQIGSMPDEAAASLVLDGLQKELHDFFAAALASQWVEGGEGPWRSRVQ